MKKLLVLLGPTGVGKTELSISLARHYNSPIISTDSRQMYSGLEIGTAAPSEEQKAAVRHFFIGNLDVTDYYNASEYEHDAIALIAQLHQEHDVLLASGGSMMYVDALCKGIDSMPTVSDSVRQEVWAMYEVEGLEYMQARLKTLDPVFYKEVDLMNHKRVIHAIELCVMTGKPYSSLRTNTKKERPFEIVKVGLTRDREQLYERINARVDAMMLDGMLDEAKRFYPQRELNSLNTVGYKELFRYLDGEWDLDFAIEKIKQSTRIYARKQVTWFKRDEKITWLNLSEMAEEDVMRRILNLDSF